MKTMTAVYFDKDACRLAVDLLGRIISVRKNGINLRVRIIETEAYYKAEKASHASLGYTEKRRALFMPPGTIYMYYARGKPSLNFSARGEGNAVLIKSCVPLKDNEEALAVMQNNNRMPDGRPRDESRLCSGQTLVCGALGITVEALDCRDTSEETLQVMDDDYRPTSVVQTTRLGIPEGRDGHLPYRFIDAGFAVNCTKNPLRSSKTHYKIITPYEDIQKD